MMPNMETSWTHGWQVRSDADDMRDEKYFEFRAIIDLRYGAPSACVP